ncbi:MAG: transglutaminase domain-containing protein, partial [Spirochaetales bacterium]|nr:transglutaminase domain-containing protein [Spirochaetales bacterium]
RLGIDGENLRSDRPSENQSEDGNPGGNTPGENGEDGEDGSTQRLQGIPADQWDGRAPSRNGQPGSGQSGEGENRQYAVMVVAGSHDPIYAADAYFGTLDPIAGFMVDRDDPLNELSYIRLIETWRNDEPSSDAGREEEEVFFLSTDSTRYLPFEPRAVQPTILNRIYHPFDFSYATLSMISKTTPNDWVRVIGINERDKALLARYLQVELRDDLAQDIKNYFDSIVNDDMGYYEKLYFILQSFETFQYNIGFSDDVSVDHIADFLFNTLNGDCTEFSNSTAVLARMAGIPSRVVTGYLATSNLQTDQHRQGLAELQSVIEPLQNYGLDEMYLVTTAHRHSWVQVYMPGYGWIDIETTSTALPPPAGSDPNSMDIIIPIIDPESVDLSRFEFPWLLVLQSLGVLIGSAIAGAYIFRYSRLIYLQKLAKGNTQKALRALFSLLLMKLAVEGYPLKPGFLTSTEYAESHPELSGFAELYTRLRYRERFSEGQKDEEFQRIRSEYNQITQTSRRSGVSGFFKRVFSLRDLRY